MRPADGAGAGAGAVVVVVVVAGAAEAILPPLAVATFSPPASFILARFPNPAGLFCNSFTA